MERSQPAQVVEKHFTPLNKPCLFVFFFSPGAGLQPGSHQGPGDAVSGKQGIPDFF